MFAFQPVRYSKENLNRDLDKPLAYGRTAELYAWQEGQVLKLFYDWFELEDIEREARISRAIYASGLPVPAVGEIIRVNNRNGLVYQRVEGISMEELLSQKPWKAPYAARRMAELHVEMHGSTIEVEIPSQRKKLMNKILHAETLTSRLRSKTLFALDTMPDGNRLCHGDFHPGNILVTAKGEIIIDWIDSSRGNPLADLARTTIILFGAAYCQTQGSLLKAFLGNFQNAYIAAYIRHYFRLSPGGKDEYNRWLPIVAAARLNENIPELEQWLIAQAEKIL